MLQYLDTLIGFAVVMLGISLLISIVIQLFSGLIGLRGRNLRWGLATLLREAYPELKNKAANANRDFATEISEAVLHHPLISDSTLSKWVSALQVQWHTGLDWLRQSIRWLMDGWQLASAIRPNELRDVLTKLLPAQAPNPAPPTPSTSWQAALALVATELNQQSSSVDADAQNAVASLTNLPQISTDLLKVVAPQVVASAQMKVSGLERWFDSIMDRVSQRFIKHTRWYTVGLALIVALATHLDAFRLMSEIYASSAIRSTLVAAAPAIMKTAEPSVGTSGEPAASIFMLAMRRLKETDSEANENLGDPPPFNNQAKAEDWLAEQLNAKQKKSSIPRLRAEYGKQVHAQLNELQLRLQSVTEQLENAGFRLAFDHARDRWWDICPFSTRWDETDVPDAIRRIRYSHVWGILASSALLSLGAPFWFNLLKTITGLRPVLANKDDKEREQRTANK